jgi:hypothetical protein
MRNLGHHQPLGALDPAPANPRLVHLQALREVVEQGAGGLQARLVDASLRGPAFLRVANPHGVDLVENVTADLTAGSWSYFWSWQEPIGPVSDPHAAAAAIRRVLKVAM